MYDFIYIHDKNWLTVGLVQTLLFSCAESNVNELEQRMLSFALGLAHEKFDILGNEQMLNKCWRIILCVFCSRRFFCFHFLQYIMSDVYATNKLNRYEIHTFTVSSWSIKNNIIVVVNVFGNSRSGSISEHEKNNFTSRECFAFQQPGEYVLFITRIISVPDTKFHSCLTLRLFDIF